jgi:MYXO-CTERM domain-containing protein
VITAGPPLVLRWIDTGNPVFPAYNNIFKSPYWLPVNERLNFPFWPDAGTLGPIKAVWKALFHPSLMVEGGAPGSYSLLVGLLVIALVTGWRLRRRPSKLLWIAIVFATAVWWVEFRYLRYLLPEAFASLVLLLGALRPVRMTVVRERAAVAAVAVLTAASFAVAVALLADVPDSRPPISAALGRWRASDYLQAVLPERDALLAFNRLAPRDARVLTDASPREWLTGGRDLYATWEFNALMQIRAPEPTSGDSAYVLTLKMGVDWVLVDEPLERSTSDAPWLPALLRTHGQLSYSAAGWDLFRLVARPPAPSPLAPCDRVTRRVPSCWTVSSAGGEMLIRAVPVCPGELISVLLSQTAAGQPAQVLIHFVGAYRRLALISSNTAPGSTVPVSGTVPPGVTRAEISVGPVAPPGLKAVRLVRFGRACPRGAVPAT